jgi:hypothetical protein
MGVDMISGNFRLADKIADYKRKQSFLRTPAHCGDHEYDTIEYDTGVCKWCGLVVRLPERDHKMKDRDEGE